MVRAATSRRRERMREPESTPRHVCIVLLTGIGDVIHGLPVANAIKRAWPRCRITWVVEPVPAGLLSPHPAINRVVVFHKQRGWRGVLELGRELAAEPCDLTLNLNYYFKSIWPRCLAGSHAPGFDPGRSFDFSWVAANRHLPPRRGNTQNMMLEFLDLLGVPADQLRWELQLTDEELEELAGFRAAIGGGGYVALVPASKNGRKDWLPERMAQVADAITERYGLRTLLLGGPGAREQALAGRIRELAKHKPVWGLMPGVRNLLWQIIGAELVIAPDTGPVHIARALETPVIGLYGHTNPWRVGPYGKYQELWVDAYTDGDPDPSNFKPKLGRMERITVADVMRKVDLALRGP
jgi:heptosyltransferase I